MASGFLMSQKKNSQISRPRPLIWTSSYIKWVVLSEWYQYEKRCQQFFVVEFFKLCNSELLSVHTKEENEFITKQLRKSSDVNKLWIGMSYKEKVRMWSWIDGSRYRYVLLFTFNRGWLERFSSVCRKTRTKVIETANQRKGKYLSEPIKTQSKNN